MKYIQSNSTQFINIKNAIRPSNKEENVSGGILIQQMTSTICCWKCIMANISQYKAFGLCYGPCLFQSNLIMHKPASGSLLQWWASAVGRSWQTQSPCDSSGCRPSAPDLDLLGLYHGSHRPWRPCVQISKRWYQASNLQCAHFCQHIWLWSFFTWGSPGWQECWDVLQYPPLSRCPLRWCLHPWQ